MKLRYHSTPVQKFCLQFPALMTAALFQLPIASAAALPLRPVPKARVNPAPKPRPPVLRVRTIEQTGGIRMAYRLSGGCHSWAPPNWTVAASPQGAGVDCWSADGAAYATWFVLPIDRTLEASYGDRYGDPLSSMKSWITNSLASTGDANWTFTTSPIALGPYFIERGFETDHTHGILFYHLYSMGGGNYVDGQSYIESVYAAVTAKSVWSTQGRLALNVAASIRCSAGVGATTEPGEFSAEAAAAAIADLNKTWGMEYAHSRINGETYLLTAASWNATAPLGPGYYRQLPKGRIEKLAPGRPG